MYATCEQGLMFGFHVDFCTRARPQTCNTRLYRLLSCARIYRVTGGCKGFLGHGRVYMGLQGFLWIYKGLQEYAIFIGVYQGVSGVHKQ